MPIIAITREMGSLGKDVARGLGEGLGDELAVDDLRPLLEPAVARVKAGRVPEL